MNGSLRLVGSSTDPSATFAVDLNGTSTSGATVSRVAVVGAGNTFDFAPDGAPVVIRLLNDQALSPDQSYSFLIASAEGGFTLNGVPVSSYTFGTDYTLASVNFTFTNVGLAVDGSNNLILSFTTVPVPEPAAVLGLGAVALVAARLRRRTPQPK